MKAKTPEAQLQLLVPATINADGVEVGVLNTQYEPYRPTRRAGVERGQDYNPEKVWEGCKEGQCPWYTWSFCARRFCR